MIIAYAKSDIGKAREMNQDAYYISDSSSEIKLYLLADGMGGVILQTILKKHQKINKV
mgnify:CR=1 FL=1